LKSKEDASEVLKGRCREIRGIMPKAVEGIDNDNQDYFALANQPKLSDDPRFLLFKIEKEGDKF
jgi:hypothetical protein